MSDQSTPVFSIGEHIPEPLAVEFADGMHAIPGAFVAELGGADEIRKQAAILKRVTHADFMRGFSDNRSGRLVSAAVREMVGQHLRMCRQ